MNRNTEIVYSGDSGAVRNAIGILRRDMDSVFLPSDGDGGELRLVSASLPAEQFEIKGGEVLAGDDMGFVYALLHISRHTLGIPPFWFWYDHQHRRVKEAAIADYTSKPARIPYRGWFINDEILLNRWSPDGDPMTPWRMAFEALLRCGGNMIIPNTQISRPHSALAASYGLWLTHHHAEPLGAEMFAKAYPDLEPSYALHKDKFHELWLEGIESQKDCKVVWNLGFRGQGDMSFWEGGSDGAAYDTDEKRGALISEVIRNQYDMLRKALGGVAGRVNSGVVGGVNCDPVCCTYIYGETLTLYRQGYIELPDDVIKIWSDNGYGKMAVRRIGLSMENPRTPALPQDGDKGMNGVYYHVSFYDLAAASHITQICAGMDFLASELHNAFNRSADDYLLVNCSNIRPHVFPLEMISELWKGGTFDPDEFGRAYFGDAQAAKAFLAYAGAAVKFGSHEDEAAGEQFYNFLTRSLASGIMKNESAVEAAFWATGELPLRGQLEWYAAKCEEGTGSYAKFIDEHCADFGELYESTIMLHGRLHYHGFKGGSLFAEGCFNLLNREYLKSFYRIGLAADEFEAADTLMRASEYGIWKGFHFNECFADFKFTAYLLRGMMMYVRNLGEGHGFYDWQRELFYDEADKGVRLQLNLDNRGTNEAIFAKMKTMEIIN